MEPNYKLISQTINLKCVTDILMTFTYTAMTISSFPCPIKVFQTFRMSERLKNTNVAVSQLKKKDLLVQGFTELSRKDGTEKNKAKLANIILYITSRENRGH